MTDKPFSRKFIPAVHQQFDKRGKDVVLRHLRNTYPDKIFIEGPRTGVDIIITDQDGNIEGYVEVEIRSRWTGGNWPWKDLHIPYRKGRYIGQDVTFYSVSGNMKEAMVTHVSALIDQEVEQNTMCISMDYFYNVPLDKTKRVVLNL